MHSMPIAEPVGVVVGVIAGRMGANLGKKLAAEWELPAFLGATVGAVISHYLASALTKAVINGAMIDPVGGGANVTVTSPITSLIHGAFEAIAEVFPDLDFDQFADFFGEELVQAQPEINQLLDGAPVDSFPMDSVGAGQVNAGSLHAGMSNQPHIVFGKALQPLEQMADCQGNLPTCGVEGGIENPIQAAYPWVGNDVSDRVIETMPQVATTGLPLDNYQFLLWQNGMQSQWVAADPGVMFNTVTQPGCGVVIHGDPHFINPEVFPNRGSYHTVFLSEPWYDSSGNPVGYIGIDSAPHDTGQRIIHVTFDQAQKMIEGAPSNAYKGQALLTAPAYK